MNDLYYYAPEAFRHPDRPYSGAHEWEEFDNAVAELSAEIDRLNGLLRWGALDSPPPPGHYLLMKKGWPDPLPAFRGDSGWRLLAAPRPFVPWNPNEYPGDYEWAHIPGASRFTGAREPQEQQAEESK